jgi:hypothetical protein
MMYPYKANQKIICIHYIHEESSQMTVGARPESFSTREVRGHDYGGGADIWVR